MQPAGLPGLDDPVAEVPPIGFNGKSQRSLELNPCVAGRVQMLGRQHGYCPIMLPQRP